MVLLDSNVLIYALNEDAPAHPECRRVVSAALARKLGAVLVPQVLLETYSVITDSRRFPRPLSPADAWEQIDILRAGLRVLPVPDDLVTLFGQVVLTRGLKAQKSFDGALVAQMRGHGVQRICSLNAGDFRGYEGIEPVHPRDVL